jgi:hypothetical protein
MLVFHCSECNTQLKLREELMGRRVRCPSCNAVITAPATSAGAESTAVTSSAPGKRQRAGGESRGSVTPATGGKAVAALILSLLNCICLPFVLTIPVLVLGFLAIRDVGGQPGRVKGRALAITSIALTLLGNFGCGGAIVAIALVGPSSLLPDALNVQKTAKKNRTINDVKELALAMQNYHDSHRRFPPAPGGDTQNPEKPRLSWRVAMLPYVEHMPIFNQFVPQVPWDQPPNSALLPRRPSIFETPINPPADPTTTYIQVLTGPKTLFPEPTAVVRVENITDGMSNTILMMQATTGAVPWTKPADIVMTQPGQPLPPGLQGQGFVVGMCDGSVRWIDRSKVSEKTLRLAIDPADGQRLPSDW